MAHIFHAFVVPTLVPIILIINTIKLVRNDKTDLLYTVVTFGTILSAICGLLQLYINRSTRSRVRLTLLTASLLTLTSILAVVGFNLIRLNISPETYKLSLAVRGQIASSGSSVFRYHFFADFVPGLIILSQTQLYSIIKHDLLHKAKRSFTLGETTIIAQLATSTYLIWALTIYSRFSGAGPFQVSLTTDIVLNIGFTLFSLLFLPSYLFPKANSTLMRYALIGLSLSITYVNVRSLIANTSNLDPFTWLVDYIFATHQRISLFSLWLSTLTACISFSTSWSRMVGETNSLVRKIFHFAICIVFISGYNQDIDFTRFAASGVVVVMFLVELIRVWELKPLGRHVEKVCQSLRGKWDNKYLTLSHIYLLVGTFLPLWILPKDSNANKLSLSSGLISVGVGDTAAAVVGTFLGKKTFPGTGKTLEGFLGNILAMILFKLIWIGYIDLIDEYTFILAAILTSITEVFTDTCDNLILPLIMMIVVEL